VNSEKHLKIFSGKKLMHVVYSLIVIVTYRVFSLTYERTSMDWSWTLLSLLVVVLDRAI